MEFLQGPVARGQHDESAGELRSGRESLPTLTIKLVFVLSTFLSSTVLANPEPSLFSFLWEDRENVFAKNVQPITKFITGSDASQLPPATGDNAMKATIKKYQPYSDQASQAVGNISTSQFISSGLCLQGSPCFTINNASTVQLEPQGGKKMMAISNVMIGKLLDKVLASKGEKLDQKQKIHKDFLFGGRAKTNEVIAHWIGPKKSADKTLVAGMLFDAWKAMTTTKKPTAPLAIRAIRVQADGKRIEPVTVCLYPANANKLMAKNFCMGRDSKDKMPKALKKAEKDWLEQEASKDATTDKVYFARLRKAFQAEKTHVKRDADPGAIGGISNLLGLAPRMLKSMFLGTKRDVESGVESSPTTESQRRPSSLRSTLMSRAAVADPEPLDLIRDASSMLAGYLPNHHRERDANPKPETATSLENLGLKSKLPADISRRDAEPEARPLNAAQAIRFASKRLAGLRRREAVARAKLVAGEQAITVAQRSRAERSDTATAWEESAESRRPPHRMERRTPLEAGDFAAQLQAGRSQLRKGPWSAKLGSKGLSELLTTQNSAAMPPSRAAFSRPPPPPPLPPKRLPQSFTPFAAKPFAGSRSFESSGPLHGAALNDAHGSQQQASSSFAAVAANHWKAKTLGLAAQHSADTGVHEPLARAAPWEAHDRQSQAPADYPHGEVGAGGFSHGSPQSNGVHSPSLTDWGNKVRGTAFSFLDMAANLGVHPYVRKLNNVVNALRSPSEYTAGGDRVPQYGAEERAGNGYGGRDAASYESGADGEPEEYRKKRRSLHRRDKVKIFLEHLSQSPLFKRSLQEHLAPLVTRNGDPVQIGAIVQDPHFLADVSSAADSLRNEVAQISPLSQLTVRNVESIARKNRFVMAFHKRSLEGLICRDGSLPSVDKMAQASTFGDLMMHLIRRVHPERHGALYRRDAESDKQKRADAGKASPSKSGDKTKKTGKKEATGTKKYAKVKMAGNEAKSAKNKGVATAGTTTSVASDPSANSAGDSSSDSESKADDKKALRVAIEKEASHQTAVSDDQLYIVQLCQATTFFPLLLEATKRVGCSLKTPVQFVVGATQPG